MIVLLLLAAAGVCLWLAYLSHRNGWRRRVDARRPAPPVKRVPRQIRVAVPHLLYMYRWARDDRPAYFGISNEPEARHRRHGVDPDDLWWYQLSDGVMYEVGWYPDRTAARAAEVSIIQRHALAGEYLANTHHNPYADRRGRR